MTSRTVTFRVVVVLGLALAAASLSAQSSLRAPTFQVDPRWPSIPNDWVLGEVSSISVDSRDHIWVLHRPRSIPEAQRAKAAPPVLEFDTSGKLLSSWGGPGEGYDWPEREHGIFVDAKNFVWISGNGGWPKPTGPGSGDDMILKFTTAGQLVMLKMVLSSQVRRRPSAVISACWTVVFGKPPAVSTVRPRRL